MKITYKEFLSTKFMSHQKGLYYMKYDLQVRGMAYSDAHLYSIDEVKDEYKAYCKNPQKWLEENE